MKHLTIISSVILLLATSLISNAQQSKPVPQLQNIKYGEHERNVIDIWFAETNKKTPLVLYIHGGGFTSGSKEKLSAKTLNSLLNAGISVAAINYRLITDAPLPAAHNDAKKALQFIRLNADQWKIDKSRIGLHGGSAGAQICMWLAFSDEMANTESDNPIERESTRVSCVAPFSGQTTMNLEFWESLFKKHLNEGANTQGALDNNSKLVKKRKRMYGGKTMEETNSIANSLSAITLASSDDPAVYMSYNMSPKSKAPKNPKKMKSWIIHHVDFGIALQQKLDQLGVESDLKYPGARTKYVSVVEFFNEHLQKENY
ncbi:alpha/beta hydrolase [Flammeovirga sp. SubArs3]|uniref:alpha/beta hydrolase n=1 Tax=Flammeovirga sp. SubArs3 TaxID=2995316 RepID=UPI00248B9878|nr:alpha/beta hydrolase [Flammeovirga sp. SubArs3]